MPDFEKPANMADAPYDDAFPVTPDDNTDLATVSYGLLIAVAGNLRVTTRAGNTVTLAVPAGPLRLRVKRVFSTSTTATGISALL